MSKKEKLFHGKDSFERMNFLYQAATMMAGKNDVLSCYYATQCKAVAKKSVLRMEPDVKRTLCKRCGLVLRPGITSDLTIETQHKRKSCRIECSKCGSKKKFVLNEKYDLWADNKDSVVEVYKPGGGAENTTDTGNAEKKPAIS